MSEKRQKYLLRFSLMTIGLWCTVLTMAQSVDFTYSSANNLYCAPVVVRFVETHTGNPEGIIWDLGNGVITSNVNPSTTYPAGGTYTIKVTAIYANTVAEQTKTIIINPSISVSLVTDRNNICQPGPVNFTAPGVGSISSYFWDFKDGTTQTTTTPAVSHTYSGYGFFQPVVKAYATTGCSAEYGTYVIIEKIPLTATVTPKDGCVPVVATFNATANPPAGYANPIYSWDFGDGTSITDPASGISHTYNNTGTYAPTLTATTPEGCVSTFALDTIAYGSPPTVDTAYPENKVICGSKRAVFNVVSPNATEYLWDFGDGVLDTTKNNSISHKYDVLGVRTVTVTPVFNGCKGLPFTLSIEVISVIASFDYKNFCTAKNTFQFTNTTAGSPTEILWSFGDGTPDETTINPLHTFPRSGNFTVQLFVNDAVLGCNDEVKQVIYTAEPLLRNPEDSICINANTAFTIKQNYGNPGVNYNWLTLGQNRFNAKNPDTLSSPVHGLFNTNLVLINNGPQYCVDTVALNHLMFVRGPVMAYALPAEICAEARVSIRNNTTSFVATDRIVGSSWNYAYSGGIEMVYDPVGPAFPVSGNYIVTYSARDNNGCVDTLRKTILVKEIPALFVRPLRRSICQGESLTLTAYHTERGLRWYPAAGLSSNVNDVIVARPPVDRTYYASVTNALGCVKVDSAVIKVGQPFIAAPSASLITVCINDSASFNVTPTNKMITWTPTTGLSNPNGFFQSIKATQNALYTAKVSDSIGCFSQNVTIRIAVKSLPTVQAGPDQTLELNSNFILAPTYSPNVRSYLWSPARQLNCYTCPAPSGVALSDLEYEIQVTSDSNCIARDKIQIRLFCKDGNVKMPAAFSPDNNGVNDRYLPLTGGVIKINKFIIYNRAGQVMYEAKNFMPNSSILGWNGRYKNEDQPMGTYVYIVQVECGAGQKISKSGSFILVR